MNARRTLARKMEAHARTQALAAHTAALRSRLLYNDTEQAQAFDRDARTLTEEAQRWEDIANE